MTARGPIDVYARRALEALRAGVPSRDAVRVLSSGQPAIEERFRRQLEAARGEVDTGRNVHGLLIGGDFGTGKSHLLAHLHHVALDEGFISSKVVISKETPLYDPTRLYRAALRAAVVPGRQGSAIGELTALLDPDSPAAAALVHWISRPDVGLNSRFAATMFVYLRLRDAEVRDRVRAFWSGDPLNVTQLRSWLRALGAATTFRLEAVPAADLALQRFAFLARLAMSVGFAGWVLFLDEVELIGRYSLKQRARSYAELARWTGKLKDASIPGLTSVAAITSDFNTAVLHERNDLELIPAKLRATDRPADRQLAARAEQGMRFIDRGVVHLKSADWPSLEHFHAQVADLYARVYGWYPATSGAGERLSTTRLRQYVRRWINEWDLQRLYPGEPTHDTLIDVIASDYSELPELEKQTEDSDHEPPE